MCDSSNPECMMHRCTNCVEKNALRKFLGEELSDIDPDFRFHYSKWQTADRASLVTVTSTCKEYKDTSISAINSITNHSLLAKRQAKFSESQERIPESQWRDCSWGFRWKLPAPCARGNPKLPME